MKSDYEISLVSKHLAGTILIPYHYLSKISKDFKSGYNYGLLKDGKIVGVCIYTALPVPELAVGMFGLKRRDQWGIYELSRLCLIPEIQKTEHNLASWFVAKTIKMLREEVEVRAILSYADSAYHRGTVYKALGFKYYGLSEPKSDFYEKVGDKLVKRSRGNENEGVWIARTQKHRYLKVFDKTFTVLWKEELWK